MATIKLTKANVFKLKPADGKAEALFGASGIPGLMLRVTASGLRSWVLHLREGGRGSAQARVKLGSLIELDLAEARRKAAALRVAIRDGKPIIRELRAARKTMAFADLAAEWLRKEIEPTRKPRTHVDYVRLVAKANRTISRRDVRKLTEADMSALHRAHRSTPADANHLVRCTASFCSWLEDQGIRPRGTNPCRGVKMFKEVHRERYLSPRELLRLGRSLAAAERAGISPHAVGAIRLLLLTGARLGEILALRWNVLDLDAGTARLPDSKSGAKNVHLNGPAREVLIGLAKIRPGGNPFVIAGLKKNAHLVDLKKPWSRIRKAALLPDVRIHDLRHSHASVGIGAGLSLALVGGLLGHSQPNTTARYAHLAADPVKAASELVGRRLAAAMAPKSRANIAPLREA